MTRIERAAKANFLRAMEPLSRNFDALVLEGLWERMDEQAQRPWLEQAMETLLAAEPELYSDPPTHTREPIIKGNTHD